MANAKIEYEPYYSCDKTPNCGIKSFIIDKTTREIINKDEIISFGVLIKRKYADNFIKRGTIKFSCPRDWIDYAEKT